MRSVWRRSSEACASLSIVSARRLRTDPRPPPTFVATTIWSRLPRSAIQRPMIWRRIVFRCQRTIGSFRICTSRLDGSELKRFPWPLGSAHPDWGADH
jgi:hypothetical protein